MRFRPCGEHAVLVELDGLTEVMALTARIQAIRAAGRDDLPDLIDVVPAATTMLLIGAEGADPERLRRWVTELGRSEQSGVTEVSTETLRIEVHYDGPDLAVVAAGTGLTPTEVVAAHTGTPWRVAFGGFAPGFAYLTGGDPRLAVPRRPEPRTSVPPGSVALAGSFSAIYPRASPGGWQLIGTTDAPVWDLDREPPALLTPGTTVRFVDRDAR